MEYCSAKTYVLGDHYVLSLPRGLYVQIPKTSCIINSLWTLTISTDCFPILLQIHILIESKESTPYAHPLIILPDCRGPAPADPGYLKERRHRRGSGNNCLITR